MKYRLLFFSLFVCPVLVMAKPTKLSTFIRFDGEYQKKGVGTVGEGVLTMASKKASGFEKFIAQMSETASNSSSRNVSNRTTGTRNTGRTQQTLSHPIESVVEDCLTGTFDGCHVTSAVLDFNNGVKFEGTLDYLIDSSVKGVDKITYTLQEGTLAIGKQSYALAEIVPESSLLQITRTISKTEVSVSSTIFNTFKPLDGSVTIGSYRLCDLVTDAKEFQPIHLECVSSIDSLEAAIPQSKGRPTERWRMVHNGASFIKNGRNQIINASTEDGAYEIRIGRKEYVSFDNEKLINCYRKFDDATMRFSNDGTKINFSDGNIYLGTIVSDDMNSQGVLTNNSRQRRTLLSHLLGSSYAQTGFSLFSGALSDSVENVIDTYHYGHTAKSLKPATFAGTWALKTGYNFEQMLSYDDQGIYTLNTDGSYAFIRNKRDYGNLAVFENYSEKGKWKLLENLLILQYDPNAIQHTVQYYPGSFCSMSLEDISAKNQEDQMKYDAQIDSLKHAPVKPVAYDIYTTDIEGCILMFKNNEELCYGLYREQEQPTTTIQYDKSAVIGRWGIADYDQVLDLNSDGTYTRYSTTKQPLYKWTETSQIGISGKWVLNGDELILISNPSLSIVKSFVESPARNVSAAEVNKRNSELHQIAIQAQQEHRQNDTPAGTFSRITLLEADRFFATDHRGNRFQFYRLQ